jgi:hypothetical protein
MADSTAARVEIPLLAIIKKADPTFFKDRARIEEYRFSNGRVFKADPTTRGAYGDGGGPDDFFRESTPSVDPLTNVFHD